MNSTGSKEIPGIKVERSSGIAGSGIPIFYVRPSLACFNSSRRFVGYDKMNKGIEKWYLPKVNYYLVDGHLIGSNNSSNALREYHRVCEKNKIGKHFDVKLNQS